METWCERFVSAWGVIGPELDHSLARPVAERSYEHEGLSEPEVAARAHVVLLRRVRQAPRLRSKLKVG